MKKNDYNTNRRFTHPVASRAVAAALAGLMFMSAVPAPAIAQAVNDAQAEAIQQMVQDGFAIGTGTTAIDFTQKTDEKAAETDASTTTEKTDEKSVETTAETSTEKKDEKSTETSATTEKKDEKSSKTDTTDTTTPTTDAKTPAEPKTARADANTTTRTWQNYKGGDSAASDMDTLKALGSAVGDGISQKYGSAAMSILGIFIKDRSAQYTTNNVMYKLYDMENQISGVSDQVATLQSTLDEFKAETFFNEDAEKINGCKELLCSDNGVTRGIVVLSNALNKWRELDENGQFTDVACSLETPVERMPKEARDEAAEVISQLNAMADKYTEKSTVGGVESLLFTGLTANENNFVNDYFNLLSLRFNWDVESFQAKQTYLAMLGQMYMNAYMVENADLRLQIAAAKDAGKDTTILEGELDALGKRVAKVHEAMFGEDGNSGYLAQTRLANENKLTCYVNGQTYDKGTYACTSAYPASCFERAFKEGTCSDADYVAEKWDVNSTFTTEQVVKMVNRLKAMKACGYAPKKADGSEVDGILEELEALGFKNVKTNGEESGTTWQDRLKCNKGWSNSDSRNSFVVSNRWVELGDLTQENVLSDYNEFHLGTRIANSCDYVVTKVTKPRMDAGHPIWSKIWDAYCAYGEVVNVKDGTVLKDQLLYNLHNERTKSGFYPFTCDEYLSTLEYYAFGCLRLGTTDPSIDAIK